MATKSQVLASDIPPYRYVYLLTSILAVVVIDGLVPSSLARTVMLEASVFAVVVSGVYAVSRQPRVLHAVLWVVIPVVGIQVLTSIVDTTTIAGVRYFSLAVLLGLFAVTMLKDVFRSDRVTHDTVLGSICGYLLFGLCFAMLFSLLILIDPDAFQVGETIDPFSFRVTRPDPLTYLSFVTMSTLGYGDILPKSMQARTLCWFEAVFGQIYLVVMVGRLVSLQIVHAGEKNS
jgi:hypothetical protein